VHRHLSTCGVHGILSYCSFYSPFSSISRAIMKVLVGFYLVIQFSPSVLRNWNISSPGTSKLPNADLPPKMRWRKRGKSGGVRKRLRRQKHRPYMPTTIMGNVRSLSNKMDELSGCVKFLGNFRDASIISFTETWLTDRHNDENLCLDGFKLIRGDEDNILSGKQCRGGLCVYINNKWCHNPATLKVHSCSHILEPLAVSLRPYYLSHEFPHVIHYCTVYIPDKSVAKNGSED
jgi:hypothetical protein